MLCQISKGSGQNRKRARIGNAHQIVNRLVTQRRSCQRKFKATLSTVTRHELTHALHSVTFPSRPSICSNSFQIFNRRPKQRSFLIQTHNCPQYKSLNHPMLHNLCPSCQLLLNQLIQNTTSPPKIPIRPTELLNHCYCSPFLFFLVKYYYIRIITLFFYY